MNSNTIKQVIKEGLEYLQAHNIDNPHLNIQLILMDILEKPKIFVLTNLDYHLTKEQLEIFWGLVSTRAKGFPLQYIVRSAEFMGLDFYVDPRVLIPRPDTEILVESVMEHINKSSIKSPKILDIGTGSGAISVSLACHIKDSAVTALDISKPALEVALKNAKANNACHKMQFLQSNLFEKVTEVFDVIVSNPPYIPTMDIKGLMTEVKDFEPMNALDGGEDGLDFYRQIIDNAPRHLRDGGFLALEGGHDQGRDIARLMEHRGCYGQITLIKDLAGIERVVTAIILKGDGKIEQTVNG